jgi:hypothetical protein
MLGESVGGNMSKHLVGVLAVLLACGPAPKAPAGSFTRSGQFVGSVSPQVSTLLARFPAGGPGLRASVASLVETDPSLADDLAFAGTEATTAQKEAIGGGLADAAGFFARCGSSCKDAEQKIRSAISFADSGTRVGYVMAATPTMSQGIPGFGNAGATTSGAFRPSCGGVMSQSGPC